MRLFSPGHLETVVFFREIGGNFRMPFSFPSRCSEGRKTPFCVSGQSHDGSKLGSEERRRRRGGERWARENFFSLVINFSPSQLLSSSSTAPCGKENQSCPATLPPPSSSSHFSISPPSKFTPFSPSPAGKCTTVRHTHSGEWGASAIMSEAAKEMERG